MALASNATALTLIQATQPVGTSSFFNAVGTFNFGNQKARLEAAGQTTVQGGNPGNGWWGDGTPTTPGSTPVRSWEVLWNNTTGEVTFKVYASSDWTGVAAMTMTRTPVLSVGNNFIGMDIGARLTDSSMSVKLDNIQFDDGSGFVDIDTAEATYSGNAFFNNYHAFANGPLTDFTLRGTALFPTGTTTGDSMRFFINGRQGPYDVPPQSVPEPFTMALGAAGAIAYVRRRVRSMKLAAA